MGNRARLFTSTQKQVVYYSDIYPDLDINENTGQLKLATNLQDIFNSLKRLCLMRPWEREYEQTGLGLDNLLFGQMDDPVCALNAQNTIEVMLPQFEKRVNISNVSVTLYDSGSTPAYKIDIVFTVANHAGTHTFSHILERVR